METDADNALEHQSKKTRGRRKKTAQARKGHKYMCIDNILTTNSDSIVKSGIFYPNISDHDACFVVKKAKNIKKKFQSVKDFMIRLIWLRWQTRL